MLLSKIVDILGSELVINKDVNIKWLLTDSRSVTFPSETLFFAIKTERNNGHKYIQELYQQGVRSFIINELHDEFSKMSDAVFLKVDDTLVALQKIAATRRAEFSIPVIGITGSNGKTIVKEWLFQLLNEDYKIVRSPRSYNSQIGVPLSVWQLKEDTQLGIFEAGISMPGEMLKLEPIIHPTIGIFTNIGDAHNENFTDYRHKFREKLILFKNSEVLIYCADNPMVDEEIKAASSKATLIDWGRSDENTIYLKRILKEDTQTELEIVHQNVNLLFYVPFTDEASIENSMHCISLMLYLNYNMNIISERLLKLESIAMRLEVKQGINDCLIINDSYNSDLNALNIAIDFLIQQASSKKLKKTIVLSDILQSGINPEQLYLKVAEIAKAKGINKIIGIGEEISKYSYLFNDIENYFFNDTDVFLNNPLIGGFKQEAILIKGSRRFGFEKISHKLELIAHETVLEVNLNSLVDNLNYFRSKLHPDTKVMCMVKAFAYGSGSVEIAKTLQHHRVDYLAVAVSDEGAELRKSGIHIPIAVMNPEKSSFDVLFENNLEPEIYSFNLLREFIEAVGRQALTDYPIHIKIDTGMHRLGFDYEDIDILIGLLQKTNQVKVRSVFSHLAGADDTKFDEFTHKQIDIFQSCADKFKAAFSHDIMSHILNSAGIERFSEYQFDMVRLGIGHYGVSALPNIHLPQVCTLKTIVLQTKTVKAGETVGYNRNGIVSKDKIIATLPIGYADGFNRKLGNGVGEVYVNKQRASVIGNVSMDLTTIDVTELGVREGDIVEIFGENITISEVAKKLQTIPYEILTGISRRVKRVYFSE